MGLKIDMKGKIVLLATLPQPLPLGRTGLPLSRWRMENEEWMVDRCYNQWGH